MWKEEKRELLGKLFLCGGNDVRKQHKQHEKKY